MCRSRFTICLVALVAAMMCIAVLSVSAVAAAVGVDDGCSSFSVFAGSAINANGVSTMILSGSIGSANAGAVIEGNYALGNGTEQIDTAASQQCGLSQTSTFQSMSTQVCTHTLAAVDLAGLTLTAGVYCSAAGTLSVSASTVTLDGEGNDDATFIFIAATTVVTASSTSFILTNGANADNVYWIVGTSASFGSSSSMVGNVYAAASITFDPYSTLRGRALAGVAITFAGGSEVALP